MIVLWLSMTLLAVVIFVLASDPKQPPRGGGSAYAS